MLFIESILLDQKIDQLRSDVFTPKPMNLMFMTNNYSNITNVVMTYYPK